MCLSSIDQKFQYPQPIFYYGWKVFRKDKVSEELFSALQESSSPIGTHRKTITDKKVCLLSCDTEEAEYLTGYHCFMKKEDAAFFAESLYWNWEEDEAVIYPVSVSDITAIGKQTWAKGFDERRLEVIVGRKLSIIGEGTPVLPGLEHSIEEQLKPYMDSSEALRKFGKKNLVFDTEENGGDYGLICSECGYTLGEHFVLECSPK